jgi:hypothetical protein
MNNATYKDFSSANQRIEGQNNEEIRKTHFTLGGEGAAMKTTNQVQYVTKNVSDLVNSKDVARGFSNTNFAFGDDRPNKISSSHIHYAHYPGGVPEKMNKEQRS